MANATKESLVGQPLKYVPLTSEVELPFYSALMSLKLDRDMLDDSARQILGVYEPRPSAAPEDSCRLQILGSALTSNHGPAGTTRADGILRNTNTMEEFARLDKTQILNSAGRQIWNAIQDGSIYSAPSLLSSFVLVSFADLKKHRLVYHFGFPALKSTWTHSAEVGRLTPNESTALVDRVGTWRYSVDSREHGFFLVKKVHGEHDDDMSSSLSPSDHTDDVPSLPFRWEAGSLRSFETGFFNGIPEEDRYVAFVDSSTYPHYPAWQCRNLLVLVQERFKMKKVQILCYRDIHARRSEARSILLSMTTNDEPSSRADVVPKVVGWERDADGALRHRSLNLAANFDPEQLAGQAIDLNLKLMKWRSSQNLDIDKLKGVKCLLLGAGTLGCEASMALAPWGVRHITFVDNGKVSYSNLFRQSLYDFADCDKGGVPKAPCAAAALKRKYPPMVSEGHILGIPMLGHGIIEDGKETQAAFETLKSLIDEHDAIFLLLDTREARWLPTIMGKAAGKVVMNAAIGFDSSVVMRHGAEPEDKKSGTLGCYFCNDIFAPVDSTKNRTLDQQCTVTRPGVAKQAGAQLAEIFTSLLQHPLRQHAPAPADPTGSSEQRDPPDHPLGIVPHQIRSDMATFQTNVLRGEAYPNCSACSPKILEAYRKSGWKFVQRALREKDYVADLSGLAEVQRRAEERVKEVMDDSEGDDF